MIVRPPITVSTFLTALDLGGTFVFALSGAAAAVKRRLDIFGVLVLAFAVGNAGGMTRDVLIGATPAAAIRDWGYLAASVLAGLVMFFWSAQMDRWWNSVLVFDAFGLALFGVVGTEKALTYGLAPVMAALLGMVTAIGGGMLRDILVNEIPVVLRADIYAVAALAGAAVVAIGYVAHLPHVPVVVGGAALCVVLRLGAMRYGWHLPIARAGPFPAPSPEVPTQAPR